MLFGGKKTNSDVEERLARVERGLKALELDWESVLERLQARLAKLGRTRQRLEELTAKDDPEPDVLPQTTGAARTLDPISQRILARRSRIAAASTKETEQ